MLEIKLTNVYGDPSASLQLQHSTLGRLGRSLVGKAVLSLALAVRSGSSSTRSAPGSDVAAEPGVRHCGSEIEYLVGDASISGKPTTTCDDVERSRMAFPGSSVPHCD